MHIYIHAYIYINMKCKQVDNNFDVTWRNMAQYGGWQGQQ